MISLKSLTKAEFSECTTFQKDFKMLTGLQVIDTQAAQKLWSHNLSGLL